MHEISHETDLRSQIIMIEYNVGLLLAMTSLRSESGPTACRLAD